MIFCLAELFPRLYDTSPVTGGGTEDEQFKSRRTAVSLASARNEQDAVVRKWALMWRSIILSTFDKTYLPYYNYIRELDLTDLTNLISDSRFTGNIREYGIPVSPYVPEHC